MSGIAERLRAALWAHVLYGEDGDENYECKCGAIVPTEVMEDGEEHAWHHAHVAEIQAELVEREIAAARGEVVARACACNWSFPSSVSNLLDRAALSPDPDRGEVLNGGKGEVPTLLDRLRQIGYGICPKCGEDKFIGHGPWCVECFTGSEADA